MDIKNDLRICREFFMEEEKNLSKCLNSLENIKEINIQCFSMKEMFKNHLIYLKTTIKNMSDICIDNAVKSSKPIKLIKPVKPIKPINQVNETHKKIFVHKVEIKKGMNLQYPDDDDFPNRKNLKQFKDIKFYYRDPSIYKEGYGLYEFIRGNQTYYVADDKKLYVYGDDNMLSVGIFKDRFQYWK